MAYEDRQTLATDWRATDTDSSSARWRRRVVFMRNFFKHPRMVGSLLQSSEHVVAAIAAEVDFERTHTLVEYGPGVGTITLELLKRMRRDARLLAIESNDEFVALLDEAVIDPRLTVAHGSAADVLGHMEALRMRAAEVVVSGIPFSTMAPEVRERVLRATYAALAGHGVFLVYQYSRRVEDDLHRIFPGVERRVEWRNGVPMQIYRCTKARTGGRAAVVPMSRA
jgi:phospholipid N-methyltransferase